MGRLADRVKIPTILFWGFLCAAVSLTSLALIGSKGTALIIIIFIGLSYAAILPAWNTLLAEAIPPEQQATGWGIISTIEGLGLAAGPAIGGFLTQTFSPFSTLLATALILFVMSLFYLFYPMDRIFNKGIEE